MKLKNPFRLRMERYGNLLFSDLSHSLLGSTRVRGTGRAFQIIFLVIVCEPLYSLNKICQSRNECIDFAKQNSSLDTCIVLQGGTKMKMVSTFT